MKDQNRPRIPALLSAYALLLHGLLRTLPARPCRICSRRKFGRKASRATSRSAPGETRSFRGQIMGSGFSNAATRSIGSAAFPT